MLPIGNTSFGGKFNNQPNDGNQSQHGKNGDLEPLSDEIPADGVIFARQRGVPGSLVVFRTQEEKQRNPEVCDTWYILITYNLLSIYRD